MVVKVTTKGEKKMPIIYKFDVLQSLKDHGYNTNRLRKEKLLAEGVIQSLRESRSISFSNLEKLCTLLHCQPGDIIEYVPNNK